MSILLKCKNISKSFSGVQALKSVDFELREAQALALVGENGAGKSTLMKILSAVYTFGQFSGDIEINGKSVKFQGTKDALETGISIIHQELNLLPNLSIAENIYLSHFPKKNWQIDQSEMFQKVELLLEQLGLEENPNTLIESLSAGSKQLVEIAKALSFECKILILDEPTSSLTNKEVSVLFKVLKKLKSEGLSLIYISHKLEEVFELCTDVTVLRDGESVFSSSLDQIDQDQLIAHMVGRELSALYPPLKKPEQSRKEFFKLSNWSCYKISERRERVSTFNLEACSGEIVGLSGLRGAGRTDLLLSCFAHSNYLSKGQIFIQNEQLKHQNPSQALSFGMALVSEDRKRNGLHLDFSIRENISMSYLGQQKAYKPIDKKKIDEMCWGLVEKLQIKIPSLDHPVKTLSGGNQQKVAIAKSLASNPRLIFLDEPTRGIDVGAKFEIYELLSQLAYEGIGIIVASSELPELMGICHRIYVMCEGRLSGHFDYNNFDENKLMAAAIGL